ncbi:hypothetical protein BCR42DRAFT_423833 [Absidia repens]|uniref:BZIP domain-containing protein n=1 Tax=Absidia repens TaxID=90262 RepID=A0A1X2I4H0_9FUNG|nr:hypothetical protein BCR42DRAFT_423833 [Absidia repens]
MDISDPLDKRHMSCKEKRQLRNKISARNFRVRRKEYINQLENLVDQQEAEINSLKKENRRLTNMNQQIVQELFQLKPQQPNTSAPSQQLQQYQQQHQQHQQNQHPAQPITLPSSTTATNSPSDIIDTLLDFNLFSNNTYLSHSLMPDFDLSSVLGDKLNAPPPSTHLEDHKVLMTMYPLLAPTLASMVIRHSFSLHYAAYLSSTFPYNTSKSKNEPLDIMLPDDWITAASAPTSSGGDGDDDPNDNGEKNLVSPHMVERMESCPSSSSSYCVKTYSNSDNNNNNNNNSEEVTWTRELERNILKQHYPYYAFLRLRGVSHDDIIRRCQASVQRRTATAQQQRKKAASSCSKWQALQGFSAVATTLLRNPSRSPMIASVIQDTKACQVSQRKTKIKVPFMMTAPVRALRIGGGDGEA